MHECSSQRYKIVLHIVFHQDGAIYNQIIIILCSRMIKVEMGNLYAVRMQGSHFSNLFGRVSMPQLQ